MKVISIYQIGSNPGESECFATVEERGSRFELFCYPCNLREGQEFNALLSTFMDHDICVTSGKKASIVIDEHTGKNRVIARIERLAEKLISVGEIRIRISSDFPGDAKEGDLITFWTQRIELHEPDAVSDQKPSETS